MREDPRARFWTFANLSDLEFVYGDSGKREPDELYTVHCDTLESVLPFDDESAVIFESYRYLEPII